MSQPLRRRAAVSFLCICAALAGPVAIAEASNATLRSTLNGYGPRILHDETGVLKGISAYQHHRPAPLIKALRRESSDIRQLRSKLAGESASSAKGRRAKAEILSGLALIARAYGALATDAQRAQALKPVPRATVEATLTLDRKGRSELIAGAKLLG